MPHRDPTILLSAGEPSGDLHGAAVAREIRRRWPEANLFGLGGPRMKAEGVELIEGLDRLAVMGLVEVVRHLPFFLRLGRRLDREIERRRPDLILTVDYPDFNLRLARRAKRAGVPVLHYIAPQVWAWRRGRVRTFARDTDAVALILPFEEALFREAGVPARYVGHPLLEQPPVEIGREAFFSSHGLDPERPVLALMPGSRPQEVERHLQVFLETGALLAEEGAQPVVARSAAVPEAAYAGVRVPLADDSRALLHHADAALVKSGTGTLEAALAGTPLVIAYRTHPATFWLARRLVRIGHIGLANLVAGGRVAPEFLQNDATPQALADALRPLLRPDTPERRAMVERLAGVREALEPHGGAEGAAVRVVDLAAELIDAP